ncbi:cell division protein FtsK [Enterococcus ureilyticus]|uniref:DNA translocase FtsK n=1 Tax=Enterococcus ureilyticus TaxID=1131292 RepID=A0A1E5HAU6_9ENTE|nr:DNA translocase FtsK [Enterococcus ureilyticus]MBM7688829.1 S-DNA-T family DNA segregation ATPase FtsK/SpoIIIE [Enterococcus ureilyticus]OEG22023.1 cell division protein FtsK [Enterococcus ureilyticus]
MAQKRKSAKKKKTKKQLQQQEHLNFIFLGIFFIFFGLFGLLKLGFLGTLIANGLRVVIGNTFSIAAILLMLYGLSLVIFGKEFPIKKSRPIIGGLIIYLGVLLFLHAYMFRNVGTQSPDIIGTTWDFLRIDLKRSTVAENVGGGMIGALLYSGTFFLVAQFGSYLIAGLLVLFGAFLISMLDFQQVMNGLQIVREKISGITAKSSERQAEKEAKRAEKRAAKQVKMEQMAQERLKNDVRELTPGEKLAHEAREQEEKDLQEPEQLTLVPIDSFQSQAQEPLTQPKTTTTSELEESGELDFEISEEAEDRDYELPPSTLLDSIPAADQSGEYQKIEKNIGVLEQTFKSFGVDAKVVKASLGPAVTKFEIQPAVGVKVSKVVSLTDDIALALAAKDVRMEAPIPGKSLIGIEVPNSTVSTVSFRDIIEAAPSHPDKLLEVPLGRDISGMVQSADLAKMPHLLIAGSTGSGKSVAINGIISSILMRAKPHEVKLMMIDPKMVELNVYNGIPHLLTPVVTNPRKAAQALQKVVQEMEFRYEKFAAAGVRNISGYNELVIQKNLEDGENRPILPFIVVIVDELADLMMVASNEVEDAIIRLAQMARAAGIHMILATQRPSVDVITGIIKANVPSRMAFAVSSGTDSRTIIDSNGAEKLLGRGDMLFLPMGENKPIRVQGAFISDHEVERVVAFVTEQQEADYQESMMPTEEDTMSNGSSDTPQDDLYEEAKALVVEMQTASISLLQRRFRIGYNRAARIVDELEEHGVIGPSEGSKPRKVFLEPMPEDAPIDHGSE